MGWPHGMSCADGTPESGESCSYYKDYDDGYYCAMGKKSSVRRRDWGADAKENCPVSCGFCTTSPTPSPTVRATSPPTPTVAPTSKPTLAPPLPPDVQDEDMNGLDYDMLMEDYYDQSASGRPVCIACHVMAVVALIVSHETNSQ